LEFAEMILRTSLKIIKPFRLVSLVMSYLLGAGLVQYVKEMKSWPVFIQGGFFLIIIHLSLECLRLLQRLADPRKWPDGLSLKDARMVRLLSATLAATLLTVATTIFITWMQMGVVWQGLVVMVSGVFAVGVLYYFSQVVEALRRFELLIEAVFFIVIPPALAYFLQSNELNRMLTMVVIALVPGYLANRLLALLKRYRGDYKTGVENIVIQMGWENAMLLHNALILFTYLLFALIALLGFPWILLWPVFLSLPIGLLQVWLMERVKRGMKPLWGIMQFASACVLWMPMYLIGFAFWIR
jgi:1,4-dihydroxy-2-naphthoate octaprenyltransferase